MKSILITLFLSLVFCPNLLGKQRSLMDSELILLEQNRVGGYLEYKVQFNFKPDIKCKKILFTLKLQPEFELLDGFTYWEGEVQEKSVFSRTFLVRAKLEDKGKVVIVSTMEFSASNKNSSLAQIELSEKSLLQKSNIKNLTFKRVSSEKNRRKKYLSPNASKSRVRY